MNPPVTTKKQQGEYKLKLSEIYIKTKKFQTIKIGPKMLTTENIVAQNCSMSKNFNTIVNSIFNKKT